MRADGSLSSDTRLCTFCPSPVTGATSVGNARTTSNSPFRNLVECMGDKIPIRLARKNGAPIAAMLTLRHRSSVVYKYGCSDERSHNLAGMPFLFWRLIE